MSAATPRRARGSREDHRTRVGQQRSARTEAKILAAAFGVFAEHGVEGPVIDDFVRAAGVSRGTFYNHFSSVEELLQATSAWTTRNVLEAIEAALEGLAGPTLRLGVGLRIFLRYAQQEPVWCRFVARVWKLGGIELPTRDVLEGVRLKHFKVPGQEAASDLIFGLLREALHRLGEGQAPPGYGEQVVGVCLKGLGAEPPRIEAVLAQPLPALALETIEAGRRGPRPSMGRLEG